MADVSPIKENPDGKPSSSIMPDDKIVIKTKHGELSLEQLAEAQHGMAHLMKEVGERYHVLYYAAKALNWKLAQYQLNQVIALFRIGATLRPKFTEDLNGFVKTHFHPMSEAIRAQEWNRFEEAFKKGIQGATNSTKNTDTASSISSCRRIRPRCTT